MHAINSIELNKLIADGKMEIAIHELVDFCKKFQTPFNKDVFLISSRYCRSKTERNNGIVSAEDYNLEQNRITVTLLELISVFEGAKNFDKKTTLTLLKAEIEKIAGEFGSYQNISNNALRLRLKNQCYKQIGEKLAQNPNLIPLFQTSTCEAILCGIAEKIKRYPSIHDMAILEQIAANATKNFTKGTIVSTLGEIIYTGELRMGDEDRIKKILKHFSQNPNIDTPLKQNIKNVKASLSFLMRKEQSKEMV
jgi:hypothetical protein